MDTRERIVRCFKQLVEEKGFYGATMDELAARNHMSKRTVYRYFKSKEELIEAVLEMLMGEFAEGVQEILDSRLDPITKVKRFVEFISKKLQSLNLVVMSDLPKHYPHLWDKVEQFRGEKIKYLAKIMAEGSKQGYFKEINPTIVTASLLAAVRAVVNPSFILENNLAPEEALQTVMHTFLYGMVSGDGN